MACSGSIPAAGEALEHGAEQEHLWLLLTLEGGSQKPLFNEKMMYYFTLADTTEIGPQYL